MRRAIGTVVIFTTSIVLGGLQSHAKRTGSLLAYATSEGGGYFSINTDSGLVSQWALASESHNSLGYDPTYQRAVHSIHQDNNWSLFSRDVTLGLSNQVIDISETSTLITSDVRSVFGSEWPGGPSSITYDTTGGGAYYNGFYYIIPDIGGGGLGSPPNVFGIELDEAGAIIAHNVIDLSSSIGDFGDITFGNDRMYFLTNSTEGAGQFGYVDLLAPAPHPVTWLSSNYKGQLGFDSLGRLWTNDQSSSTLTQLDPETGETLQILDLTGNVPSGDWFDFAIGPTHHRPGDYDGDGDVDGADFLRWQRDGGTQQELELWQHHLGEGPVVPGDLDCDGDVDGADFLYWQRDGGTEAELNQWRQYYGNGIQLDAASFETVPEPRAVQLMVLGLLFLIRKRFLAPLL